MAMSLGRDLPRDVPVSTISESIMEQTSPTHEPRDFTPAPSNDSRWDKIKKTLLQKPPKKRLIIISGVGVILLMGGVFAWFWQSSNTPEPYDFSTIQMPEPKPEEPVDTRVASPLTGELVEPELAERRITAVMIENSIDARPQSGLEEAGIVFEAIAEGGITRFMALFQEQQPSNIGPIRSARPYYVEWARGFDASYVHSGGSPEALALIKSIGVKDLDHGNYGASLADRVSYRFAPHNVYTSMNKVDSVANSAGFTSSDFDGYARIEESEETEESSGTEATAASPSATSVSFDISSSNYNTSYAYDKEAGCYKRTMAQRPHTDKDSNKQICPNNIVALETTYSIHSNRIHSVYKTVGSGNITVFQNGEAVKGTWKKTSQKAPLEFLDTNGEPLEFAVGKTWITAIPAGRVSYQ